MDLYVPRLLHKRPWTADEIETVRSNYAAWPTFLIAHLVGHSEFAVTRMARKIGVAKTSAFHKNPLAHLWNGTEHPACVANRIKPGNVPPNKGQKRPGWAPGRMAETQFKKGRPASDAANYVPIGTEKFDPKRKVLMRKITDDPSIFPVKRWRPVHVLVWEAARGPVPEGYIVVFKPGQKTLVSDQITVEKLDMITLAENMRRNTIHNLPAEIGQAIHAKACLTRAINRANRGAPHV